MKEVDYLIVGCGFAGVSFIEEAKANNKSVLVFDDQSQRSSTVAGGMYNPVVLKRFTAVWKSQEQLDLALPFYKNLEAKLGVNLDYKLPVYRRFVSSEEQNNWFAASDKPNVGEFISTKLIKNTNQAIAADFGYGEVLQTGRIDSALLMSSYRAYLKLNDELNESSFQYNDLEATDTGYIYHDVKAKHVVFAEGFGLKQNPFFNYLPLHGSKGELLIIHAPELKMEYLLKSSVFVMPLGDDLYKVGATYEREDKTNAITEAGKNQLLTKLKTFLNCDFTIVDQVAGIRPTVKDRRPLVGEHPKHKNMYILNGLGSRGVIIGPYVSKALFNSIENNGDLDPVIDIKRYQDA
ncbi:FAD-dependent oxidoreductase [Formosa agariphila KMM 3901]|uniref:FAD-dependent oxidoreductase n=1 Tax=Formosa agariphila (strain DSM 15362 / KCTC 12365 / LMG 23005 / KMM 3901 / M-2Alg 35-1) TaxID=1347342 RepID=T2KI98_FORAG|nr:FAD-dependent oxidoreductase [Formosa agariphila]CDF78151.1 FAD-dependent oxidoreductase [Formosa agariphila KMM 3901]